MKTTQTKPKKVTNKTKVQEAIKIAVENGWDKEWDSYEGQTHHFRDVCGEPAHNPDSQDTVDMTKKSLTREHDLSLLSRVFAEGTDKSGYCFTLNSVSIICDHNNKEITIESKTNYWKYACIAILLGAVVGMVLSTPLFVKLAEVCTQ
jgi:hypothetical protein